MRDGFILAIDQGTSSTKCLLVDGAGTVAARGQAPLGETCPAPGAVEQDGEEIWTSVKGAVADCLKDHDPRTVAAVAISNQRESLLMWERASGRILSPALNWRDNRTAAAIDARRTPAVEAMVRAKSGLPLDSMFSAAKARWILDAFDPDRKRAEAGEVVLGTIDAFLLSRFGGEAVIEIGNASRTQLLDIHARDFDDDLSAFFGVPRAALPTVVGSAGPFPTVKGLAPLPDGVPVLAVFGDSHAALFAHGAYGPGPVKATYGTGSSIMGIVQDPKDMHPGICLTIGWMIGAEPAYAAEGNILSSGATLKWVADLLGITPEEVVALGSEADAQGVALVPGFTGLGAPWWDREAVGLITNLTPGAGRREVAGAAMEAIAHQITDVVEAIDRSVGGVTTLLADGGPTRAKALMQLQADISGRIVEPSDTAELSALGAAHLAGVGAGFWTMAELAAMPRSRGRVVPQRPADWRGKTRAAWAAALARARFRAG